METESSQAVTGCHEEVLHSKMEFALVKVNDLVEKYGYHTFNLHTRDEVHDKKFPYRHGVTLCQKFTKFFV